jgi:HK97 family phage portal protein
MASILSIGRSFSRSFLSGARSLVSRSVTTFRQIWDRSAAWAGTINGARNNAAQMLQISSIYAACRVMGGNFACLPIKVEKRTPHGYVELETHRFQRTFDFSPCPGMTPYQWLFGTAVCAITEGSAYAHIEPQPDGSVDIWPIPPRYVLPMNENGQLVYKIINPQGGGTTDLYPYQILHFRWFPHDSYNALRTSTELSDVISTMSAANEFARSYLENGLSVGGTIEVPGKLDPKTRDKLLAEFRDKYAGAANAGRLALLEGGWKFSRFTPYSLGDAKLSDVATFAAEEASRITGCPLSWLAHPATISSVNPEIKSAELSQALSPLAQAAAEELTLKLLHPSTDPGTRIRFDTDVLVRPLLLAQITAHAQAVLAGIMKPSESRKIRGLPFVEGSDRLIIPSNTSSLGQTPGAPLPSTDKSKSMAELGVLPPLDPKLPPADPKLPRSEMPDPLVKPLVPGSDAPAVDSVASTALNGAQIASLIELVSQAKQGLISKDEAKAIAKAGFPNFSPDQITQIFGV